MNIHQHLKARTIEDWSRYLEAVKPGDTLVADRDGYDITKGNVYTVCFHEGKLAVTNDDPNHPYTITAPVKYRRALPDKWPAMLTALGGEISGWNTRLDDFMILLAEGKDEHWWVSDTALKYLNLRIDTRSNTFCVYLTGGNRPKGGERIDPMRVARAILNVQI